MTIRNLEDRVSLPVMFRPYAETDVNFILNSWLKSYKGSAEVRNLATTAYYQMAEPLFKSILAKSGAVVVCDPNDYNHLYAYAVAEYYGDEDIVFHWIYVKHPYRGAGIAKALVEAINPSQKKPLATFWSPKMKSISKKHPVIYSPDLLGRLLEVDSVSRPVAEPLNLEA